MSKEEQLEDIYRKRKQDCLWCIEQGYTFEQMNEYVAHYQDEIDAIFPKKKDNVMGGGVHYIFRIVGGNLNNGGKYDCKKSDTTINGKSIYCRVFIKRIGYEWYDKDGVFNAVLDNADEDDINWYKSIIKNKYEEQI